MNKKILIHSIVFSPDGVSTAYLYNDIAMKFKDEGYEVIVLTTTPHYNILQEELAKQPLKAKCAGLYYESNFQGIKVLHIPQKKFKSPVLRMIGFIYWHFLSLILGICQKNISIILSPSPPLTIAVVNIIVGKIKGSKVIYNVQEIYPDFLINQGNLTFKPFIRILKAIEKFVYNHSTVVTTIDPVFYNAIAPRFKEVSKLHIIPNFVDTMLFKPINPDSIQLDDNLFPPKKDVLKVMYAGNIGHAQDWEPLIEAAKNLKDEQIEFWVIGEGVKRQHLMYQISKNELNNIHLISYQSRSVMPIIISYADLHFIFMSAEMEAQGFPSKVYTIMACAKPLIVISGKHTPIYNFLSSANSAILIDENSLEGKSSILVKILKEAVRDKSYIQGLGLNGYHLIEKYYSKAAVTKQYVKLANQILD